MIRYIALILLGSVGFAVAQEPAAATDAGGAILRGLDKVNGNLTDYEMKVGDSVKLGRLEVKLLACRYPTDNPSGDAFARLMVREPSSETTQFSGWVVASSPALNALDHPRYDIWVLRCMTS